MSDSPALIVGLGNPGQEHERDRHNAGFWLVDSLAAACGATFRDEKKLQGYTCQVTIAGETIRLLKPHTFMNHSGRAVRRAMDYYKLTPAQFLIVHDDLDLPPGVARFKQGGGHGGNNGLRDVIANCGKDFLRLRIGIGHPGEREKVVGYVLRPPGRDELTADAGSAARGRAGAGNAGQRRTGTRDHAIAHRNCETGRYADHGVRGLVSRRFRDHRYP